MLQGGDARLSNVQASSVAGLKLLAVAMYQGPTSPNCPVSLWSPARPMPDILQDFPIAVPPARVFEAVTSPALLDQWWTLRSSGRPVVGSSYSFDFGPQYQWQGRVTVAVPGQAFEWRITEADADWTGTRLGFRLEPAGAGTQVAFHHTGWPEANAHYRTSCHCWAMYLRILRRHLEAGETVPYAQRLEV